MLLGAMIFLGFGLTTLPGAFEAVNVNVIVLEAAESRGETFSFMEFLKAGLPTTIATCAIAIAFLILLA